MCRQPLKCWPEYTFHLPSSICIHTNKPYRSRIVFCLCALACVHIHTQTSTPPPWPCYLLMGDLWASSLQEKFLLNFCQLLALPFTLLNQCMHYFIPFSSTVEFKHHSLNFLCAKHCATCYSETGPCSHGLVNAWTSESFKVPS